MLVSVVMPVYNGEVYLEEAIQSILSQTMSDFEFIIVNDGSIDRTKEILDHVMDSRVRVIHLTQNGGAASAMNKAIEQAKGEWIAVQDADDKSMPARLEEQIKHLEAKDLSGVASLVKFLPGKRPLPEERLREEEAVNGIATQEQIKACRFHGNPICHGTLTFSKQLFHQVGGYNSKFTIAYDYELWMKLFAILPIEKLGKVLYQYRVNLSSLGHSDMTETSIEVMAVSSNSIRRICFSDMAKSPRAVVICSPKGCQVYQHHVLPDCQLDVVYFLYNCDIAQAELAYQLFLAYKVDLIIVLDGVGAWEVTDWLIQNGLEYNQHLFTIWNDIV
ncbi:glycosyltransferase family 2 protein [Paenibacillus cremeus]|uniref:Glycosyltransferase family 2 protein n=1 Tax=Paenibacillus cremeus TaxID=2163881 RepID=A0A559JGK7_9BACL|nr:glycosyltransferase family 2 protein [Paenibacillus cremeus]TVX99003.1 glycosyltransferase family 2 protein [Paenibacillus cremeus]